MALLLHCKSRMMRKVLQNPSSFSSSLSPLIQSSLSNCPLLSSPSSLSSSHPKSPSPTLLPFILHRIHSQAPILKKSIQSPNPITPNPVPFNNFAQSPKPIFQDPIFFKKFDQSPKPISPNPIFLNNSPPSPKPISQNPILFRNLSSTAQNGATQSPPPQEPPELKHEEITGPTVDRDLSALANETRQSIQSLTKAIYGLSSALAMLGFAHLGAGAWIAYAAQPAGEVTAQGVAAFAFPFSVAFLMRRAIKPVNFLWKMEQRGRLQILTLALQVSKALNILFLRTKVVCVACIVGVSLGTAISIWLR